MRGAAEDAAALRLLLAQPGWAVWNAPRPLHGEVRWAGPFRRGACYAAGPAARFATRNADLGAATLELVDEARLLELLDERLAADGYSRAELADCGMSVREACVQYGLPRTGVVDVRASLAAAALARHCRSGTP